MACFGNYILIVWRIPYKNILWRWRPAFVVHFIKSQLRLWYFK